MQWQEGCQGRCRRPARGRGRVGRCGLGAGAVLQERAGALRTVQYLAPPGMADAVPGRVHDAFAGGALQVTGTMPAR
jgi:hypothetical protein